MHDDARSEERCVRMSADAAMFTTVGLFGVIVKIHQIATRKDRSFLVSRTRTRDRLHAGAQK